MSESSNIAINGSNNDSNLIIDSANSVITENLAQTNAASSVKDTIFNNFAFEENIVGNMPFRKVQPFLPEGTKEIATITLISDLTYSDVMNLLNQDGYPDYLYPDSGFLYLYKKNGIKCNCANPAFRKVGDKYEMCLVTVYPSKEVYEIQNQEVNSVFPAFMAWHYAENNNGLPFQLWFDNPVNFDTVVTAYANIGISITERSQVLAGVVQGFKYWPPLNKPASHKIDMYANIQTCDKFCSALINSCVDGPSRLTYKTASEFNDFIDNTLSQYGTWPEKCLFGSGKIPSNFNSQTPTFYNDEIFQFSYCCLDNELLNKSVISKSLNHLGFKTANFINRRNGINTLNVYDKLIKEYETNSDVSQNFVKENLWSFVIDKQPFLDDPSHGIFGSLCSVYFESSGNSYETNYEPYQIMSNVPYTNFKFDQQVFKPLRVHLDSVSGDVYTYKKGTDGYIFNFVSSLEYSLDASSSTIQMPGVISGLTDSSGRILMQALKYSDVTKVVTWNNGKTGWSWDVIYHDLSTSDLQVAVNIKLGEASGNDLVSKWSGPLARNFENAYGPPLYEDTEPLTSTIQNTSLNTLKNSFTTWEKNVTHDLSAKLGLSYNEISNNTYVFPIKTFFTGNSYSTCNVFFHDNSMSNFPFTGLDFSNVFFKPLTVSLDSSINNVYTYSKGAGFWLDLDESIQDPNDASLSTFMLPPPMIPGFYGLGACNSSGYLYMQSLPYVGLTKTVTFDDASRNSWSWNQEYTGMPLGEKLALLFPPGSASYDSNGEKFTLKYNAINGISAERATEMFFEENFGQALTKEEATIKTNVVELIQYPIPDKGSINDAESGIYKHDNYLHGRQIFKNIQNCGGDVALFIHLNKLASSLNAPADNILQDSNYLTCQSILSQIYGAEIGLGFDLNKIPKDSPLYNSTLGLPTAILINNIANSLATNSDISALVHSWTNTKVNNLWIQFKKSVNMIVNRWNIAPHVTGVNQVGQYFSWIFMYHCHRLELLTGNTYLFEGVTPYNYIYTNSSTKFWGDYFQSVFADALILEVNKNNIQPNSFNSNIPYILLNTLLNGSYTIPGISNCPGSILIIALAYKLGYYSDWVIPDNLLENMYFQSIHKNMAELFLAEIALGDDKNKNPANTSKEFIILENKDKQSYKDQKAKWTEEYINSFCDNTEKMFTSLEDQLWIVDQNIVNSVNTANSSFYTLDTFKDLGIRSYLRQIFYSHVKVIVELTEGDIETFKIKSLDKTISEIKNESVGIYLNFALTQVGMSVLKQNGLI